MSEPILSFLWNNSNTDSVYTGTGEAVGDWKKMTITTVTGTSPDMMVFTGGGIHEALSTPTATYGSREATLRPSIGDLVIPQTYVESDTDSIMYNVPLAGQNGNRYVFAVYVDGYIASDLYLEAWDDSNFSTTALPTLSGTVSMPFSMFNAIRTTDGAPPTTWSGSTYSGTGASAFLSGYSFRVRLKGSDSAQNEALYYNLYVRLPSDAPLFHNQPVLAFRYLYV